MNELNMNAELSYNSSSDSLTIDSGTTTSDCYFDYDYWGKYPELIREYYTYPVYINTSRYEDTYRKAFNIAKLLLKKKLLVSRKLKDFIGLVEEIAKEL